MDEKNSILSLDNEFRYGLSIGGGINGEDINSRGASAISESKSISQQSPSSSTTTRKEYENNMNKAIERMIKPRAYPLFLLEKFAIVVEDVISSLTSFENNSEFYVSSDYKIEKRTKERIVVLGTGWGAAAFLKEIDTNMFDVTVISPRNFFLFTPMLAGASVGTVEFRSITENIRQVGMILFSIYLMYHSYLGFNASLTLFAVK